MGVVERLLSRLASVVIDWIVDLHVPPVTPGASVMLFRAASPLRLSLVVFEAALMMLIASLAFCQLESRFKLRLSAVCTAATVQLRKCSIGGDGGGARRCVTPADPGRSRVAHRCCKVRHVGAVIVGIVVRVGCGREVFDS